MQPYELSLTAVAAAIRAGRLSPVELVDSVLERVERLEPHLNAYATVTAEQARHAARKAADDIAAGRSRGPLHGIPMGLKDLIDVSRRGHHRQLPGPRRPPRAGGQHGRRPPRRGRRGPGRQDPHP